MNVMKNRKGMTGLETAIILIAFVITAAAFSFVVLNMGFLSAQKTQTVISSGMKEASSSIQADGDVIATMNVGLTNLDAVTFYVRLSQGKEPVDTVNTKLIVTMTHIGGHVVLYDDATALVTLTPLVGDADSLIESGERWSVLCNTAAATIGAYETFRIEMRPSTGSVLIIERNVGAINSLRQVLE